MHETRVGGQEPASTLASAQVSVERDGSKEQEISRWRGYHITCRPDTWQCEVHLHHIQTGTYLLFYSLTLRYRLR